MSIILLALLDRLRGSSYLEFRGYRIGRVIGQLGMGLVAAWALELDGWQYWYAASVVILGSMQAWGEPLGAAFEGRDMNHANLEYWQRGILARNIPLALVFRGLMWGVLLVIVNPLAPLAFVVPFVVTPYLARWFYPSLANKHFERWALMELTRGAMTGAGLLIVS